MSQSDRPDDMNLTPAHAASRETGSQRAARIREEARERKRKERAIRRASGLPDPRELDRALVDAIRDAVVPDHQLGGSSTRTHPASVDVRALVREAARSLQGRGFAPAATVPALIARVSRDAPRPH